MLAPDSRRRPEPEERPEHDRGDEVGQPAAWPPGVTGTNRVHEAERFRSEGDPPVDGSVPGNRDPMRRRLPSSGDPGDRIDEARWWSATEAPGNWGDDVGRSAGAHGRPGVTNGHVGSAAPGNRGGWPAHGNRPPGPRLRRAVELNETKANAGCSLSGGSLAPRRPVGRARPSGRLRLAGRPTFSTHFEVR